MSEQWRPVIGYEGIYEVSDLGRVRSLDRVLSNGCFWRGRTLTPVVRKRGYPHVSLHLDGVMEVRNIHRIVLEAFVGPRPDGMEARHLDGDRTNNALANLRWGTDAENARDMVRHGTHWQIRKTHCPRGHEYTPENTYPTGGRRPNPGRGCRECSRLLRRNQLIGATP